MKKVYACSLLWFSIAFLAFFAACVSSFAQGRLELSHQSRSFYPGCRLHLGHVRAGTPLDRVIRLDNLGTASLTGVSASTASSKFTLPTAPPATIGAASGQNITVRFQSNESGVFQATLTITSSDPENPSYTLILEATAVAPSLDGLRLVVNEFSNGGFGEQEYIELVAVGEPGACVDLRGYRLDDNSGRGSSCGTSFGISTGYLEFTNHAQWAHFPVGGIIVVYNPDDVNFSIGVFDPYDGNGDYVYTIPVNDANLFRLFSVNPSPIGGNCNVYDGQGSSRYWSVLGIDDAGDLVQVVRPDGTLDHSVSYALSGTGADVDFSAVFSGMDRVFAFMNLTGDDPKDLSNWMENSTAGMETPGFANSLENQRWIDALRPRVFVCADPPCANRPSTLHTNARATSVSSWNWDFDDNGSGDASESQPTSGFTYPFAGEFRSILSVESQSGACILNAKTSLTATDCQNSVYTNLVDDFCVDDVNPASVSIPFIASGVFFPGNVFTAWLVGPSGEVQIGTLAGTSSGSINASIPAGTENGSNYRIRIDASSPATTGLLSPTWSRVVNIDTRPCDIALMATQFDYTYFDPATCAFRTESNAKQFVKVKIAGQPIGAVMSGAVADVEWLVSSVSPSIGDMAPFPTPIRGLWYTPYFTTAGTYYVRARAACPCGGPTYTDAVEIIVQSRDSIAYQGGELDGTYADCWQYRGFAANNAPATVNRVDPTNAKTCDGTLTLGFGSADHLEMRDLFLGDVSGAQLSIAYRTDGGFGPGLDSGENLQFEYSIDCGQNWLPMGGVGGGGDLQFDWTENQVGYDQNPGACCRTGQYSASANGCGFCADNDCPSCQISVALNPLTLNLPVNARNVRLRVRTVNNSFSAIALNRADEVVYFDDIRLNGTMNAQPTARLVMNGVHANCRESEADLTASVENFDLTGACGMQYEFQWWVDGILVATDLSDQPTANRTVSGLSNRSSVWVNIGLYAGSDPAQPNINGCLLFCPPSNPIVIDSIPVPTALLTVRDVSSTLVCRPKASVLRVELEGSAPWAIQYSVDNGPPASVSGINQPTFDFDWFPSADGTYSIELVSVSDANCTQGTVSGTVLVTVISPPVGVDAGLDQVFCRSQSMQIDAPLGNASAPVGRWNLVSGPSNPSFASTPTQYQNELRNLQSGSYAVTWTQGQTGCETEDLAYIHVYDDPAPAGADETRRYCESQALLLTAPPNPGTGLWTCSTCPTAANIHQPNNPTSIVDGLTAPNVYVFTWTVANGPCTGSAMNLTLDPNAVSGTDGLWRGFMDGDWQRCANWDNQTVPNAASDVRVETPSTLTPLDWATVPATTVRSLELNANASTLPVNQLSVALSLNERLLLRSGLLRTDRLGGRVRVLSNDPLSVAFHSTQSYVSGILERAVTTGGAYDFPVGTDAFYQFASVETDAGFAGSTNLTAQFIDRAGTEPVPPPNNLNGTDFNETTANGFWRIEPDQPMAGGAYGLTLQKRNAPPVGVEFVVVKRGADWALPLAPASHQSWTLGPGYIEASAVGYDAFSEFDIAYTDQPFGLHALNFDAEWLSPKTTLLTWDLTSSSPIASISLERSPDMRSFDPIQRFDFSELKTAHQRQLTDRPDESWEHVFYRLHAFYADGKDEYSEVRQLSRERLDMGNRIQATIYPNPSKGVFNLSFDYFKDGELKAETYDLTGKRISSYSYWVSAGNTNIFLDFSDFPAGLYSLRLKINGQAHQLKLVLQPEN